MPKNYFFYSKNDSNQEPIGKIMADSQSEAEEKFAVLKRLPLESFLNLFSVKTK